MRPTVTRVRARVAGRVGFMVGDGLRIEVGTRVRMRVIVRVRAHEMKSRRDGEAYRMKEKTDRMERASVRACACN